MKSEPTNRHERRIAEKKARQKKGKMRYIGVVHAANGVFHRYKKIGRNGARSYHHVKASSTD